MSSATTTADVLATYRDQLIAHEFDDDMVDLLVAQAAKQLPVHVGPSR